MGFSDKTFLVYASFELPDWVMQILERSQINLAERREEVEGRQGLVLTANELLFFSQTKAKQEKPVSVNFSNATNVYRYRSGVSKKDLLSKAIGWKGTKLSLFDATLGLGNDTFTFLNMGIEVEACEQNPLLYILVRFGLERFSFRDWVNPKIKDDFRLFQMKAENYLPLQDKTYDVIYFDPMFKDLKKKSSTKKAMEKLQNVLVTETSDEGQEKIFNLAKSKLANRMVVKRSRLAPLLFENPSFQVKGKSVRYDVYCFK